MKKSSKLDAKLSAAFMNGTEVVDRSETYKLPSRQTGGSLGQNRAYDTAVRGRIADGDYTLVKIKHNVYRVAV